jgi:hypothetical protein
MKELAGHLAGEACAIPAFTANPATVFHGPKSAKGFCHDLMMLGSVGCGDATDTAGIFANDIRVEKGS